MRLVTTWMYAISKYGYPPTIHDTLKAISELAQLGLRYVELEGLGNTATGKTNMDEVYTSRRDIVGHCRECGVQVTTFFAILPELVSLDSVRRDAAHDLFAKGVEIAAELGCDFIATDSFVPPLDFGGKRPYTGEISYATQITARIPADFEWDRQWKVLVSSFRRCAEKASANGLRFLVEPRVGEMISNTDALMTLLDSVNHPAFGGILDTGHLHAQKELLPLSVEKLGSRLSYVHAADNDGRDNYHLAVGKGTIDWEGLFAALNKIGYSGDIGIDIGLVPDLADNILSSKNILERLAKANSFDVKA